MEELRLALTTHPFGRHSKYRSPKKMLMSWLGGQLKRLNENPKGRCQPQLMECWGAILLETWNCLQTSLYGVDSMAERYR